MFFIEILNTTGFDCECCGGWESIDVEVSFAGVKKTFGTKTHFGNGNLSSSDEGSPYFFIDIISAFEKELKDIVDVSDMSYEEINPTTEEKEEYVYGVFFGKDRNVISEKADGSEYSQHYFFKEFFTKYGIQYEIISTQEEVDYYGDYDDYDE